jgi:hypothetical protein
VSCAGRMVVFVLSRTIESTQRRTFVVSDRAHTAIRFFSDAPGVVIGQDEVPDSFRADQVCDGIEPGLHGYKTETVLVEPDIEAPCKSRVVGVETVEERNRGVSPACDRLWPKPQRGREVFELGFAGGGDASIPCTKLHRTKCR